MKNTFAELLTEVISQSEISKNEMIRTCDIDRSSFFKFLSGQRIPTMEQFNRICEKLQFSPSEEKSLRLEYAKITQGEQKIRSGHRITLYNFVLLIEEVVDLKGSLETMFAEREQVRKRQVAGVPGLGVVLRDVGDGLVAFARIDETVVEMPFPPREPRREGAAVPGNVRQLATVKLALGLGLVLGTGIGVGGLRGDIYLSHVPLQLGSNVESQNLAVTEVHHGPAELVARWQGHNLVVNGVVVGVECE